MSNYDGSKADFAPTHPNPQIQAGLEKMRAKAKEDLKAAQVEDQVNILDLTTCLLLRFHKTGLIRKGNIAKIQTTANKDRLGLHKKILTSDNYEQMLLIARDIRRHAVRRQIPGSPFAEGTHLMPLPFVDDMNAKISNAEAGYNHFADLFVAEYAGLVEEAKIELDDQFDASNYFDTSTAVGRNALRAKFWVERRWFDWSPPSDKKVGKAVANQERSRQATEIQDMALQVKAALRMGLKKLIDHLVERLAPQPNGSRKTFMDSTITKITDFLELFSARNVCGDKELAILADQAKEVLQGQTASAIKENEELAAVVTARMSTVKSNLDKLLLEMPERALYLDDGDDDEADA